MGEFLWDVWVGGGDFKVLLLKPEFMISPLVWILALLRVKIPMALSEMEDSSGGERMQQRGRFPMMVVRTDLTWT